MLFYTHVAFGFLAGLLAKPFFPSGNTYLYYLFVFLGSILPDIDERKSIISQKTSLFSWIIHILFKHRGIFHSLWFALLFSAVVYYITGYTYAFAFFIGYMSHILADGLTKQGVNVLHPFAKFHIRGFIETGKILEWAFFALILALIFAHLFS